MDVLPAGAHQTLHPCVGILAFRKAAMAYMAADTIRCVWQGALTLLCGCNGPLDSGPDGPCALIDVWCLLNWLVLKEGCQGFDKGTWVVHMSGIREHLHRCMG
mmetsp:Transcript_4275/g.7931  ORF Transcript_4275/g.7931 Transcript_4275/m.7931 type:complete len:103 (+) Transcript_4275:382-690(+)